MCRSTCASVDAEEAANVDMVEMRLARVCPSQAACHARKKLPFFTGIGRLKFVCAVQ